MIYRDFGSGCLSGRGDLEGRGYDASGDIISYGYSHGVPLGSENGHGHGSGDDWFVGKSWFIDKKGIGSGEAFGSGDNNGRGDGSGGLGLSIGTGHS
jgi:hypothetical protein